jgi:hypothetical protein
MVFYRRVPAGQDFQIPIRTSPLNCGYATLTNQNCHRHLRIDNYRGMIKPHASDSLPFSACKIFSNATKAAKGGLNNHISTTESTSHQQRMRNSKSNSQSLTNDTAQLSQIMGVHFRHLSRFCTPDISTGDGPCTQIPEYPAMQF